MVGWDIEMVGCMFEGVCLDPSSFSKEYFQTIHFLLLYIINRIHTTFLDIPCGSHISTPGTRSWQ
jgi:hypothetical protein